ncbi:peptidoglycan recognition protein family protein [Jiella mangrovi]|uniref:N-acetylmuramoyl-L-alanine amidase n=1 Tax=Jiella mangrovi TaxID=2821407 RepID=A0ABS4BEL8_9HYPH|nr:N-acetylmuramoyl-L-alanine amidase [Jiella mangrovi]MBP0615166.1 N-acetylmuramoyl-L-alanine amidase [Jiella mangrovi]
MAYALTWLAGTLLDHGLKVAEVDGWEDRGTAQIGRPLGVMCHHTGSKDGANMPALDVLTKGRPGFSGPLANIGVGRDGTFYVIAAGRANHAGRGSWKTVTNANAGFIAICAEHSGLAPDPWPAAQMEALQWGAAALLKKLGAGAEMCCGHKEYAEPFGSSSDPAFDMEAFRRAISGILAGDAQTATMIEAVDPSSKKPTLRRGAKTEDVKIIQRKLGSSETGEFDHMLEAGVRAFQRTKSLNPDGIVGPKTWSAILR